MADELELRGRVTRVRPDTWKRGDGQEVSQDQVFIMNASGTAVITVIWSDYTRGAVPVEGEDVHLSVSVRAFGSPKGPWIKYEAVERIGAAAADAPPAPPRAVKSA